MTILCIGGANKNDAKEEKKAQLPKGASTENLILLSDSYKVSHYRQCACCTLFPCVALLASAHRCRHADSSPKIRHASAV